MNKIINGHRYNSDTAEKLASWSNDYPYNDFNYCGEELYRTRSGRFFIYGEGGAMSKYAKSQGDNNWSGGEAIEPITEEAARKWAEECLTGDQYEAIFGTVEENTIKMSIDVTVTDRAKLDEIKARTSKTYSQIVSELLREAK